MFVHRLITHNFSLTFVSIQHCEDSRKTGEATQYHGARVQRFSAHLVQGENAQEVGAHLHARVDGEVYVYVTVQIPNVQAKAIVYHAHYAPATV